MSDEGDIDNNGETNNDDRFTKVENDVINIEGYRQTKAEEELAPDSSQATSDKDKPPKEKKEYKKFKIILLGEKGVGKSSLIDRYVNNNFST